MGGYGSGRRWRWNSRDTVEGYRYLDVRKLHLRPGAAVSLSWSNRETGKVVDQPVRLTWTRCNYGGQRPWFVCRCNRRVAILYQAGMYFFCRHCYQLVYASQRWDRANRLMEKARNIRVRLGGTANLFEPFPWKPKKMHWTTYWRLRRESEQANCESWLETSRRFGLLRGMG